MYLKFIAGTICRAELDRGFYRLYIGGKKVLTYFNSVDEALAYAEKRLKRSAIKAHN